MSTPVKTIGDFLRALRKSARAGYTFELVSVPSTKRKNKKKRRSRRVLYCRLSNTSLYSPLSVVHYFYCESETGPWTWDTMAAERMGLSAKKTKMLIDAIQEQPKHDPTLRSKLLRICKVGD